MISLRPYQERGVCSLRSSAIEGVNRNLLVLPTGGGKTVVASSIIHSARRNFDGRVLFVAHRVELIDQAVAQLARWGVTEIGVIRANDPRTNPMMPVQVASIQTLARREIAFEPDIIFIDEAHRSVAESYRKLFAMFPNAKIIGLTATPCRTDGKPLGELYGALHVCATYADLIADGFIVEPLCIGAERHPDLSGVHTVAGDYNLAELESAMMQSVIIAGAIDAWKEHASRCIGPRRWLRTVVFASGVAHSKKLVTEFEKAGARAVHVDGDTPTEVRERIGTQLRAGEIDVVCNFGVYTEGWDEPCVKCCILLRPTKSLVLWRQMVGRVLRPWRVDGSAAGESVQPLILDHALCIDRHGMPTDDIEWSIDGPPKRIADPTRFRMCAKCFAYTFASKACVICGHVPEVKQREMPREVKAPLVPLTQAPDEKRRFFDEQVAIAQRRGFKPGYASAKWKEKYCKCGHDHANRPCKSCPCVTFDGKWPPWNWSQQVKAIFASDLEWQAAVKRQVERREYWQSRNAEQPQQTEAQIEKELDHAFADFADPAEIPF